MDFSFLKVDIHSHLIPGIDDGSSDMETSLKLIKGLVEIGYQELYTTPHVMGELYPNSKKEIELKGMALQDAVTRAGIKVKIGYAAEYYLDDYFETLLKEDDLLTLPGNHLLLEMSFLAAPSKLEDYLFQSRLKGYQLILAHPERYIYLRKQYSQYERLRDLGCKFQVNLLSLIGYYGKEIKKNAFRLLKNGWVEYLGTDCHHGQHLELLTKAMHRGEFNFPKINFENNTIAPA